MNNPHIVRKSTSPLAAPPEAGIHWINVVTNEEYFSVGTNSVNDWIKRASATELETLRWYEVEYFTLTEEEIDQKYISLAKTPNNPIKVLLTVYGALASFYGLDFTVSGNVLTWNELGLDGLLNSGDILQVVYIS